MPNPIRLLWSLTAVSALLLVAGTESLAGQSSTTRGLNLGFHLQGASLSIEGDDAADEGGGAGIRIGYGFNRIVTLFAELDGAVISVKDAENLSGDWGMAHVDLGARFHFANSLRRWVPYLEAALGFRSVGVDDAIVSTEATESVSFNGGSFSLGGGLGLYLTQTFALDFGLKVTSGEFTEVDLGNVAVTNLDIDATSTRFSLGIVWWP
ncbi:outer membrane beta-barrel protein [Gemmatimonadota bacterium]